MVTLWLEASLRPSFGLPTDRLAGAALVNAMRTVELES